MHVQTVRRKGAASPHAAAAIQGGRARSEEMLLQPLNGCMPQFPAAQFSALPERAERCKRAAVNKISGTLNETVDTAREEVNVPLPSREDAAERAKAQAVDDEFCEILQGALDRSD